MIFPLTESDILDLQVKAGSSDPVSVPREVFDELLAGYQQRDLQQSAEAWMKVKAQLEGKIWRLEQMAKRSQGGAS